MTTKAGRTINASGLQKIEAGVRRVDVDDLMALALCLGVTPNTLLLPYSYSDETSYAITGGADAWTGRQLWEWARGREALPVEVANTEVAQLLDQLRRHEFVLNNNPDESDGQDDGDD
ncbi:MULTISPECIES: hypothetical protein [Brevibacterium]|nr:MULTISPECIES: hypothetical protein [Brevibacterium]